MFIGKDNPEAAVLLLAETLPTPEATNTNAADTREVAEIASTGETKKHNGHHEPDDESVEDDASESSEEDSSEQSTEVAFNEQVVQFAIKEVGAFSNKPLSSIKRFLERVTADVAAYDGATKKDLNSESEFLTEFLLDLKKLEKDDDALSKFSLLIDIAYNLEYYDYSPLESDNRDEYALILEYFEKYNFKSLVDELRASAEDFKNSFRNKVKEFWQKLPDKERGNEEEFEKWFKSFVYHRHIFENSLLFGRRD